MARTDYPLTEEMQVALESLYEDLQRPLMILGVTKGGLPQDLKEEKQRRDDDPIRRAVRLRQYLEETVQDLAAQEQELGSASYTAQVRNEIAGVLIALRELHRHLPEAFDR